MDHPSIPDRKTCAFPVFRRALVIHLSGLDLCMADRFLYRLDGTIVLQGLGDKSGPAGMRREAGNPDCVCVFVKQVVDGSAAEFPFRCPMLCNPI
jgi:hypothetical protein